MPFANANAPLTSEALRQAFLDFFAEKQHTIVPSASLVPQSDPTLLFINAGMNPFKDVFLGEGERPYVRVADTQKCLRVSGKHNDLEEVGLDTYHHTFFEMLGNWSFGDYFKREAISWAWELLVERWGLPKERLYVTVHEGDAALGLGPDDEAAGFWRDLTSIDASHILQAGSKDNFWMMGETGPCGPCSEIHIDLRSDAERAKVDGAALVNADDPRVIEIWNLVFIQYNAQPDGSLKPLPAKHIDTGMGFERLLAAMNGHFSTYDTDLFAPLLSAVARLAPDERVRGGYDAIDAEGAALETLRVAMRVIVDHVRTVAFALGDGVTPGNVGRGYVIRRVLRRAARYGYQALGFREPFLYQLVAPLAEKMGEAFPDLVRQQDYITRAIQGEEESFLQTLGTGIDLFDGYAEAMRAGEDIADLKLAQTVARSLERGGYVESQDEATASMRAAAEADALPGEVAFVLFDTYGFPVDLTELMAREAGLRVDRVRFDALLDQQRERARSAASFSVDQSQANTWRVVSEGEDSQFIGYDETQTGHAHVRAARTVESDGGPRHELILDVTPFYAESGGQVGDTGTLEIGGETVNVLDTRRVGGKIVHYIDALPGDLTAPVTARVDAERRARITKHHTATHLLHAALREALGTHVAQRGSRVEPSRLRFDFSHFERVTPEELAAIERRVNALIQANAPRVEERALPFDEALERGALALFGEKYGDVVRMVAYEGDSDLPSIELCGGTHVGATGEIGLFRFLSEGSVASGVRRVEAVVGMDALGYVTDELDELGRTRAHFRQAERPADEEVADVLDRVKALEAEVQRLEEGALESKLGAFIEAARDVDGMTLVTGDLGDASMDTLRTLGQTLRDRLGETGVGVLGARDAEGGKAYLVASVGDGLTKRVSAGKLVGVLARKMGGGGGGRPQLATAGGKKPEGLGDALESAEGALRDLAG